VCGLASEGGLAFERVYPGGVFSEYIFLSAVVAAFEKSDSP
jgi:hypothetical protein